MSHRLARTHTNENYRPCRRSMCEHPMTGTDKLHIHSVAHLKLSDGRQVRRKWIPQAHSECSAFKKRAFHDIGPWSGLWSWLAHSEILTVHKWSDLSEMHIAGWWQEEASHEHAHTQRHQVKTCVVLIKLSTSLWHRWISVLAKPHPVIF